MSRPRYLSTPTLVGVLLALCLNAASAHSAEVVSQRLAAARVAVIVRPDAARLPSSPEELVNAINEQKSTELTSQLGDPVEAWLLTSDRWPVDQRDALPLEDPKRMLDSFVVLQYESLRAASSAVAILREDKEILVAHQDIEVYFSNSPPEPLFPYVAGATSPFDRQWGMRQMFLEATWDFHFGAAYVGVLDSGVYASHEDLQWSLRQHFSANFLPSNCYNSIDELQRVVSSACGAALQYAGHGTMVAGIIAAANGNGKGVAGACWNCSVMIGRVAAVDYGGLTDMANGLNGMVSRGAQVVNISLGGVGLGANYCGAAPNSTTPMCLALANANVHEVVVVAAAGNDKLGTLDFPASDSRVIPVGGTQVSGGPWDQMATLAYAPSGASPRRHNNPGSYKEGEELGSNTGAHLSLMVAPARDVLSTAYPNRDWNPELRCGTTNSFSPSLQLFVENPPYTGFSQATVWPYNRQYGVCTGTSFSAPHVSGVMGMIRGAHPLLSRHWATQMLILTGSQQPPNSTIGSGVPNALAAVNAALVDNGRLTPLFVSYSTFHNNYLLTIVPQMATAAMLGSMLPTDQLYRGRYYTFSGLGSYVANYGAFPTGAIPTQQPPITTDNYKPRARLKVFTTKKDASGADLCHIFRFSRSTPSIRHKYAICGADRDATFPVGSGWNYDGVEGYVYPPTAPQPANTVAIQRWWNPASGTFMLVPNVAADQAYWTGLGFQSDGTGILGYAYLN